MVSREDKREKVYFSNLTKRNGYNFNSVLELCKLGNIQAYANYMSDAADDTPLKQTVFPKEKVGVDVWNNPDFEYRKPQGSLYNRESNEIYIKIYTDKKRLDDALGLIQTNKGGRPRKYNWEKIKDAFIDYVQSNINDDKAFNNHQKFLESFLENSNYFVKYPNEQDLDMGKLTKETKKIFKIVKTLKSQSGKH